VGDAVYNPGSGRFGGTDAIVSRQFLHAAKLGFALPDGTERLFEADLPDDLSAALDELRATVMFEVEAE
jgi:hypothetical protein